jgi:hypothetical protein
MLLKLSNKSFYKRHSAEINRYITSGRALHIINKKSQNKVEDKYSTKYFLDNEDINLDSLREEFSSVVLTDVVETHPNVFELFSEISIHLKPGGKLIISSFNTKYKPIIKVLEFLNLKDKTSKYTFIQNTKIKNIISGLGFEQINFYTRQIVPFHLLGFGTFLNLFLESLLKFLNLGIKTYSVYRLNKSKVLSHQKTIIIPAKNEEGNLETLIKRIPRVEKYEIMIPCGISEDKTFEISNLLSKNEEYFKIETFMQSGNGKANAVWEAMHKSTGDVIAILDADISVDPETLPHFFEIIDNNLADFVNGTRLIYQMEKGSMRAINHFGNRLFQYIVSKIINQPLSDSLCGTKVFKRELIEDILLWQNKSLTKDPFGDFDLLFTASFTGQKIIEFPIHYRARQYGVTQISRFKDGFKLIKYLIYSYFIFNTSKNY